eukprot:20637-Heterococcus_DN1.PRE.3
MNCYNLFTLIGYCTVLEQTSDSADRPFSESERVFLEKISTWRKKVVLVINKVDILNTEAEREQVIQFVGKNGALLLQHGASPTAVPTLHRRVRALQLCNGHKSGKTATSKHLKYAVLNVLAILFSILLVRLISVLVLHSVAHTVVRVQLHHELCVCLHAAATCDTHMVQVLSREERVRSKLLSPIGVAEQVAQRSLEVAQQRLQVLESDVKTLALVDEQMAAFMTDMERDVKYEKMAVERVLTDMVQRADVFMDKYVF